MHFTRKFRRGPWVQGGALLESCSFCVAGVLQEAGDAEFDYVIIPCTSTFIRLSRLYQECHAHCIVVTNDVGMG